MKAGVNKTCEHIAHKQGHSVIQACQRADKATNIKLKERAQTETKTANAHVAQKLDTNITTPKRPKRRKTRMISSPGGTEPAKKHNSIAPNKNQTANINNNFKKNWSSKVWNLEA